MLIHTKSMSLSALAAQYNAINVYQAQSRIARTNVLSYNQEAFGINTGVRMHLMALGATPDEIEHLQSLIHRIWNQRAYVSKVGVSHLKIWIRCTARKRYRKGSSTSVFAMAPFNSLPRSKLRSTQFVVYQLPSDATLPTGDPWAPLFKIKDLDLNQPHQ